MAEQTQVLTANRLRDGDVVYWRGDGWQESLAKAQIFPGKTAAQPALKEAEADVVSRLVVNPYLFEVRVEGGKVRPIKEREIIRAAGPTVRPDLGKQAESTRNVSV